jgi:3-hydroxy-5-methyl-1-naphthoate 3-O-methyltransferase
LPDTLTAIPESDPTLLYRYRDAMYAADMLIVGLHLDLFTRLASTPSKQNEICAAFGIARRPADVMLTLFCAMGLLERSGDVYQLARTAREHLVKGSPWYLGPYYPRLEDRPVAGELLSVLRSDKPANWGTHQANQDWHKAMEREDFAASFTAAMDSRGIYLSQSVARAVDLRQHHHLLDIAGGSGIYACALAAHNPNLKATVLEKPPVDRIAAAAIAKRGLNERVSVVASDMLSDPLPTFPDVHLFSNVLHDWDVPVVTDLLNKSFAALPPGGLVVVHDAFLNATKTGPLHVAEYSVLLVHASEGRCYSTAEMETCLEAAGFVEPRYTEGAAARGIMTALKPGR